MKKGVGKHRLGASSDQVAGERIRRHWTAHAFLQRTEKRELPPDKVVALMNNSQKKEQHLLLLFTAPWLAGVGGGDKALANYSCSVVAA